MLNDKCVNQRSANVVGQKIEHMESKYRAMKDWLQGTGTGLKKEGKYDAIAAYMKAKCKFYYELDPIMCSRPNSRPLYTNEGVSDYSSSYDEEEEDAEVEHVRSPVRSKDTMAGSDDLVTSGRSSTSASGRSTPREIVAKRLTLSSATKTKGLKFKRRKTKLDETMDNLLEGAGAGLLIAICKA